MRNARVKKSLSTIRLKKLFKKKLPGNFRIWFSFGLDNITTCFFKTQNLLHTKTTKIISTIAQLVSKTLNYYYEWLRTWWYLHVITMTFSTLRSEIGCDLKYYMIHARTHPEMMSFWLKNKKIPNLPLPAKKCDIIYG